MTVIRLGVFVVAGALTAGLVAFHQGSDVTATCGTVSTPLNQRMISAAESAGGAVRALAEDDITPEQVTEHTLGMWETLATVWQAFGASGRGEKRPADAQKVRDAATSAQAAALSSAGCGATRCQGLGGIPGRLSGPDLAADALRKAGFPASEIPTFVAVAEHETGFRNITGPTVGGGTMRGMWQLNDRYWKLDNWQDPYANAVMAKRVRDDSVARGDSPWYPWSTWRAAVRDAGKYAKYASASSVTDSALSATPSEPDCTGAFDATVATWNSAAWNSTGRVVQGFRSLANDAQVIAGQELPSEARRAAVARAMPAGWRMYPSAGGTRRATAVPILVDTNRLEVIAQGREKVITRHVRVEHGSDGFTTGPKFVTWVTVRDGQGRRFSVVNTHLVVSASPAKPRRLAQWRKQVAGTLAVAGRLSADPVVITCDCNAQHNPFGGQGYDSSSKALGQTLLTHTNRTLDYVATAGAEPAGQALAGPWGSDHKALLVTFQGAAAEAPAATPEGFDMPGNRTVDQAVAYMTTMAKDQTGIPVGRCLHYVAAAYGHETTAQAYGRYWARDVFATMPDRYKHPGADDIPPRGALVFWDTGGPGHIALSLGGGKIASTDYPRAGVIGIAPISEIDKWGKRMGWTWPVFTGRTKVE